MGIKVGDTANHAAAMGLKASRRGAVILSVQRGSAAQRRNLRRGDVIVGLSTSRVKSVADLTRLGQPLKPGQRFHIIVQRKGRIFSFYMRF
jgi:S1-C subfamily serine protease